VLFHLSFLPDKPFHNNSKNKTKQKKKKITYTHSQTQTQEIESTSLGLTWQAFGKKCDGLIMQCTPASSNNNGSGGGGGDRSGSRGSGAAGSGGGGGGDGGGGGFVDWEGDEVVEKEVPRRRMATGECALVLFISLFVRLFFY
jgi:hypothetical protein